MKTFQNIVMIGAAEILLLCSCNPSRFYKGIEKHPPVSVSDSQRLASRSAKTFPAQPSKTLPGKTIVKTVVKRDSTAIKELQDSIRLLFESNEVLASNYNSDVEALENTIYKLFKKTCIPVHTIDSVFITDTIIQRSTEDAAYIRSLEITERRKADKIIELSTEIGIRKKSAKNRLWIIIGIVALVAIYAGIKVATFFKGKVK